MLNKIYQGKNKRFLLLITPKYFNTKFSYNNLPTYKDAKEKSSSLFSQPDNGMVPKYQYTENFKEKILENITLDQLLAYMKQLTQQDNKDYDTWYKCLQRFNEFLCDHQISKNDILALLSILDYLQPKVLERKTIPDSVTRVTSQLAISQKHEEEYLRIRAPKDTMVKFALFLKKSFGSNLHKYLNTSPDKGEYRENINEDLNDLIGVYDIVFTNIEKKIIDDISNGRVQYSHNDCVELIKSFSRNTHGTNMFFEVLMRKIAKHASELTLPEIEILLNYLPHDLFNNEESEAKDREVIEKGRTFDITQFYKIVFGNVLRDLDKIDSKIFLGLWQGILRIKFIDIDVVNAFLTSFEKRIVANAGDKIDKKFFFDFLQIFAYFAKIEENEATTNQIDFELVFRIVREPFINKNLENFDLKEITTIFWIFYHFRILDNEKVKIFETKIRNNLLSYLNDPKSNIDTMGYETHKRYYDQHNLEPYDIEALNFFISKVKDYKGDLLNILKRVLKSIELENTHPISRKLFHF
jgi:hypothetical protein